MAEKHQDDALLEALFAEAAGDGKPEVPADLMARILADAEAMQPTAAALAARPARQGLFSQFMQAIGGWPSLAGLATATVAGVWIGFSAYGTIVPSSVADLIEGDSQTYLAYVDASYAFAGEE
jgi:hypothetical protein